MTENKKIVIELVNLGEGHIRTVKRELKVIIEDYFIKKMLTDCVRVKEKE